MDVLFVLVEPARPENVGAAARAMKTMGFTRLTLVDPVCDPLHERALRVAHGSREILEQARVVSSFDEATAEADFVIGTTAKRRMVKEDYYPSTELLEVVRGKGDTVSRPAIVFGREESGLTNEELSRCTVVTRILMPQLYPSLNLGQAVMIYAYTLSPLVADYQRKQTVRDEESLKALLAKVDGILEGIEVKKNPLIYNRMMERVAAMEQDDIHLLHSVCTRLLARLGQAPPGGGER